MDPRCKICIFMGKTDPDSPKHKQQVKNTRATDAACIFGTFVYAFFSLVLQAEAQV